jgi:hypothetical protein
VERECGNGRTFNVHLLIGGWLPGTVFLRTEA